MPLTVTVTGSGWATIGRDGTVTSARPFVPTRTGDHVRIAFPSTSYVGGGSFVNGVMINSSIDGTFVPRQGRVVIGSQTVNLGARAGRHMFDGDMIRVSGDGAVGINAGSMFQSLGVGTIVNRFTFGKSGLVSMSVNGKPVVGKDRASASKATKKSGKKKTTVVIEDEEEGVRQYDLGGTVGTLRVTGTGMVTFHITEPVTEIECSGTADVEAKTHLDVLDELVVRVSGTGDVRLDLSVKKLRASVSGTGDISNPRVTESAVCDARGTGDIRLMLSEKASLDKLVMGLGTVKYTQCP